jgi:FAD/FMN-containing dehydrogenase
MSDQGTISRGEAQHPTHFLYGCIISRILHFLNRLRCLTENKVNCNLSSHSRPNIQSETLSQIPARVAAVKVTAGTQWTELYAAAAKRNRTVVGGVSIGGTVGASGGWILGGGHSVQSPTYGLGK